MPFISCLVPEPLPVPFTFSFPNFLPLEDLERLVGRLVVVAIPPDGLHGVLVATVTLQDLGGGLLPLLLLLEPLPLLFLFELPDLKIIN